MTASDKSLPLRPDDAVAAGEHRRVPRANVWLSIVRLLRPHQWSKNLVLLVPVVTAHQLGDLDVVGRTLLGIAAFSLCASGIYVFNDLVDVRADRLHPRKRTRAFAAGDLPLALGYVLSPLLVAGGLAVASFLPPRFLLVLVGYILLTTAYGAGLKRIVLLDVFCLAAFYTIRLIAGHEASLIDYSAWLLIFSMFIFLSLALAKRFQELRDLQVRNGSQAAGRGYHVGDLQPVGGLGLASGSMAVVILALYINSEQVQVLYRSPMRLIMALPLMMFWISRLWMIAWRGDLHDDPVVFTLRDKASYLIGILMLLVLWVAT